MTPAEALSIAGVAVELWPNPPMSDVALGFYAETLRSIPTTDEALAALRTLASVEAFRPPPGRVVDECLGSEDAALRAWCRIQSSAATLESGRRPADPGHEAMTALRLCGHSLRTIASASPYVLDKVRVEFLDRYRSTARQAAVGALSAPQEAVAAISPVRTDSAARRLT